MGHVESASVAFVISLCCYTPIGDSTLHFCFFYHRLKTIALHPFTLLLPRVLIWFYLQQIKTPFSFKTFNFLFSYFRWWPTSNTSTYILFSLIHDSTLQLQLCMHFTPSWLEIWAYFRLFSTSRSRGKCGMKIDGFGNLRTLAATNSATTSKTGIIQLIPTSSSGVD